MSSAPRTETVVVNVDTQIMTLEPGLYLFRYASDLPEGQQVPATLQAAPVGTGQVDFFPGVGVSRNTLRRLGDCIVVRVTRAEGGVLIAKYRIPGRSSAEPVQVQVDVVDTSGRFVRAAGRQAAGAANTAVGTRQAPSAATEVAQLERVELHGHLERQGDVSVSQGWLGDPNGSARVEGFAVHWYDRPNDVDLVYRCHVEGLGESPTISSGGFAGTRRRGAPITAVAFALTGANATSYELKGQAGFAGGQIQPIIAGLRLTGPTQKEQLCALHIAIVRKHVGEATVPRSPSPWDDPSVTQVFRMNH